MGNFVWEPSEAFLEHSNVSQFMKRHGIKRYQDLLEQSVTDLDWFWNAVVEDLGLVWDQPYRRVLDISEGFPWTKWFRGGQINITKNCIDRHVETTPHPALIWEGEDGSVRKLTYRELAHMTNQVGQALKNHGIEKGDVVGLTLPMLPETVATLMACFRIGAIALPIFSGFGPKALAYRLERTHAKVLVSVDITYRRGRQVDIFSLVKHALEENSSIQHVLWIVRKHQTHARLKPPRDVTWTDAVDSQSPSCDPEVTDAEDPCMVLYTSGTTGTPKGAVHTHAGSLAQIGKELKYAFDVHSGDVFYWFTDIGWMMGPWEIIGVTLLGGTVLLTEGAPDSPDPDRLWRLLDNHRVRTLGISPTAIRLLMKYGERYPSQYAMSTLELLGSTGEPWDPESYIWFFDHVGKRRCPIINISGGTELIGCLLSPLPIMPLKACSLGGPGLGMDVDVFGQDGQPIQKGIGHLVCKQPCPSMTKGFWGEEERYLETYFSKFPKVWYHGDWASVDEDGQWFLHGRSDDTVNIAGKRVGPAEFESALMNHESVAEAAAVGIPHKLKGEGVVCFVVLHPNAVWSDTLADELKTHVTQVLGKSLAPERVLAVPALPKTRSAKIVRGLIKKAYLGHPLGDLSSVENPEALSAFQTKEEAG